MTRTLLFALLFCSLSATCQTITTVAGTGTGGFSGDGGPAILANIDRPNFVALDQAGNLYICDAINRKIRKVNSAGIITTVAGNGTVAHTGDGGTATAAGLLNPSNMAIDRFGNIYIGETGYIRKVSTDGIISTVGGTGTTGYNGDGIPATDAQLEIPYIGGVDKAGTIYFSDFGNNRVRTIDTSGMISTIAGTGVNGYSGDGGQATAAQISGPGFLYMHGSGDLYVPDNVNHVIRKIEAATGIITTFAGNGTGGSGGDGGPATAAQFTTVNSIAFDSWGNAYVADLAEKVIRKIDGGGIISRIAGTGVAGFSGDGGPAIDAQFSGPNQLCVNAAGNVFIADYSNNRVRKITYYPDAVAPIHTRTKIATIYPNPARGLVTIAADDNINHIAIINVAVQTVTTKTTTGKKEATIDVHLLPAGLYQVEINGMYAGNFVKE